MVSPLLRLLAGVNLLLATTQLQMDIILRPISLEDKIISNASSCSDYNAVIIISKCWLKFIQIHPLFHVSSFSAWQISFKFHEG